LKRFVQIVRLSSDNWNAVIAKPSLLTELRLPDSTTHALIMALVGSAVRQALPMRVAEAKPIAGMSSG
jgi:phosphate/sulfate permease